MPQVWLSLGSNIERERNLHSALTALTQQFGALNRSSVYESDAVGFEGAPFYNLIVSFTTEQAVTKLAQTLRQIEYQHGRSPDSRKFSARTLDIDLILYGDLIQSTLELTLPRADILKYAFVLQPLAEIAPDARHPVTRQRYAELWQQFDKTGLEQTRIAFSLP